MTDVRTAGGTRPTGPDAPALPLSAVLIVKNEEAGLPACLDSLRGLCREIVVVDDHSTDGTVAIARRYTERILTRRLDGFGAQKQFALEQATEEWVLSIDADERLTPALRAEIRQELAAPRADGYEIRREVLFLGRPLRHGGLERDRVLRLFRRTLGAFTPEPVHEHVVVRGQVARLRAPLRHETHQTLHAYLEAVNLYSTLAAERAYARGRRFRVWMHLSPVWEFLTRFGVRLGFLDGHAGFLYAALSAYAAWLRALKLREIGATASRRGDAEA